MRTVYTRSMQKDVVQSVNISWSILMFMGGAAVAILVIAVVRATLFPPRSESTVGVFALSQDATQPDASSVARHVVVPPVLGDAVLGSSNVCGCPGCCSVLSS